MNQETFNVDAALLQELGERLIGKAHIALAELIKNSYDADAIDCKILFDDDRITIVDDGHGMSVRDFLDHWMLIGTTHKANQRISKTLGRPLTGSKGIGRLSAQFLASEMVLLSTTIEQPEQTLIAIVDWTKIEHGKDLDTVEVLWDTQPEAPVYPNNQKSGTWIELRLLRTEWNLEAFKALGDEVCVLRPPFKRPKTKHRSRTPEDFYVDVEAPGIAGAFEAFDEERAEIFDNWRARIRGQLDHGRRYGNATVTVDFKMNYPKDTEQPNRYTETVQLPLVTSGDLATSLIDRVSFEILIFKPEGRQGKITVRQMRKYLERFGNVSIYDGGFRLPYYGSGEDQTGQDWLNIALDQGRRLSSAKWLPEHLRTSEPYMEDLPAPGRLLGAVEIDTNHERALAATSRLSTNEWLQIQSSRDRLHNNLAFFQLRDLVRFSLDFYANRYRRLSLQVAEKAHGNEPSTRKLDRAVDILTRAKTEIPAPVYRDLKRELTEVRKASAAEEATLDRRAALLAPLATAGMTALALCHELARESRFLAGARDRLLILAKKHSIPDLDAVATEFQDLYRRFDALQQLFAPLLSDTDMVASDRLRVRPLVQEVLRSMRPLLPGVSLDLRGVSPSLRFPVGSFAEWSALLQNVIANAWNATLDADSPAISFDGDRDRSGREWLRVSDTGKGLDISLKESTILFEPFERRLEISQDNRSIAIGGQGLGLAIVRMIAHRRSAKVRFAKPIEDFSTTFEISWRGSVK